MNASNPLCGGNDMLDHIYRLVSSFKQEHGVHPNLLYLNLLHSEHLKSSFDETYTLGQIMNMLQMEMILDPEIIHPHVAWTQTAQRAVS